MLNYVKDTIKNIIYGIIPPSLNYSFSQAGEDMVIDFLFREAGLKKPMYLEIGAGNPVYGSNTYGYYLKGSRGVLVEADERLIPALKSKRPSDKIILCGITEKKTTEAEFYVFDSKGISTFSKEEALNRQKREKYKLEKIVKIPLFTINEIIETHFNSYPDLLSIDIEGLDFEVLKSLDYVKFPVPVICAETCTYSENQIKTKDLRIKEFLTTKGYFDYADTYINTIFVNRKWFLDKIK